MRARKTPDISEAFAQGRVIDTAMARGVRDALRQHKQAGNPVAEWRDGRTVWIPPAQIQVNGRSVRGRGSKGPRRHGVAGSPR
jgi:hypothetical protein